VLQRPVGADVRGRGGERGVRFVVGREHQAGVRGGDAASRRRRGHVGQRAPDERALLLARRGLGEVAEQHRRGRGIVGGIGRIRRAAQVRERLARAAGAEREQAAGVLHEREHEGRAGGQRHPLGRGGVRLGLRLVALQRGDRRQRGVGDRAPHRPPHVAGEPGGLDTVPARTRQL
jgi:hypothetical protein